MSVWTIDYSCIQITTVSQKLTNHDHWVKGKGRALVIVPQVDTATTEALRYMASTKQRRTYLPYTFPAAAGTHLPTLKGWCSRVVCPKPYLCVLVGRL